MHRNFLRGLLIVLIPTVFFGACAFLLPSRPGIDLKGGTILVYELDLEKTKIRNADGTTSAAGEGLSADQMQQLAESLKKRIDPVDTKNVIIRPVGGSRVEIILPFTPKHGGDAESAGTEDFVQFVKDIVSQVGVLEFRILANDVDDADGIRDAEARLAALSAEEALTLAKAGSEPPAPSGAYRVKVNDIDVDDVRYEWKELGREERQSLGLNKPESVGDPRSLFSQLAATRGRTFRHSSTYPDEGKTKSLSMLFFSREFKSENPRKDEEGKKIEYYVLTRVSPLDQVKIGGETNLKAEARNDQGKWVVSFAFTSGASRFTTMTDRNRPTGTTYRSLAILLDNKVVSAPSLNQRLDGGGQISGSGFTKVQVDKLVYILRSGALTAELKPNPVSENFVGPTLGDDTRRKGLWSVGLAFGAVLLFMMYYYRFAGFVACFALLINLLLTIGFMNAVNAVYTLAGLAGIVLMLGMAVDANVLIYERLREERAKGATLSSAIRAGYDRALPTIIDTHLTSIFTSVVLYAFGNDNLKGFAISLTVGLVISLGTSLYVTRLIFDFFITRRWLTDLKMKAIFTKPNIDFMAIRKQMFTLTAVLTVLGLALFLFRGEQGLNVDFRGGTAYGGRLNDPIDLTAFQKLLDEENQKNKLKVSRVSQIKPQDSGEHQGARVLDDRTFNIYYGNETRPVVVSLSNDPAGPGRSEQENKDALIARASTLPDVSVEQVFLTGEKFDGGGSKSFTLRTTEREPELVQVILDRLLRDPSGKPLIAATTMTVGPLNDKTVELTFSEPTSVNYVASLLKRQFRLEFHEPLTGTPFSLTGITEGDAAAIQTQKSSGKYKRMLLDIAKNTTFEAINAQTPAPADKVKDDREVLLKILNESKITFESRPAPERLETFDAALAQDTQARALYAILASWAAILMYLWFRFGNWTFGLAAVLCLFHDLCFTLGAITACHYIHDTWIGQLANLKDFKIDLATVAALLTLVGYSVNEIIVNFARLREIRGKNPVLTHQMINQSVNQTLSRTILTSTTVFLASFVLYAFGGDGVHLFGMVMATGVLISTYSSIYIGAPLLLILGEGQPKVEAKKSEKAAVGV